MTVAGKTQTGATFEIKSSQLSVLAFHLKTLDLQAVEKHLEKKFSGASGEANFFDSGEGEPVLIDLHGLPVTESAIHDLADFDFGAFKNLLARYQMLAVGVRGLPEALRKNAAEAGLFLNDDGENFYRASSHSAETPTPHEAPAAPASTGAMIIDRPLRSGQQIYARGRDLIVLSMVNAGAEIVADGHIHVYAPLRGKAMAGASGNIGARIFTASLEAELISIAGVWKTSDAFYSDKQWSRPVQISLELPATQTAAIEARGDSLEGAKLVIASLGL